MDDNDKALVTSRSTLPMRLDPQSVRLALSDRMTLSEAIEVVGKMLRGYANGGQQASKSYIGALAEVLSQYPRCVASQAGDLMCGVPRETKFLPTPADVIAWCERESKYLYSIADRDNHHRALEGEAKRLADVARGLEEKRKARPTYDDLKAKYGENWGITNPDHKHKWTPPTIAEICRAAGVSREAFEKLNAEVVEQRRIIAARESK